jgi:hypothetical protein
MDIEVIHDEVPLGRGRISRDGAPDMRDKVGLGPGRPTRWAEHLPGRDVEVDDERAGPVAAVFELPAPHLAGAWRQVWCHALQGLDARHLVRAHRSLPQCGAGSGGAIHRAHVSDLRRAVGVGGRGKP